MFQTVTPVIPFVLFMGVDVAASFPVIHLICAIVARAEQIDCSCHTGTTVINAPLTPERGVSCVFMKILEIFPFCGDIYIFLKMTGASKTKFCMKEGFPLEPFPLPAKSLR